MSGLELQRNDLKTRLEQMMTLAQSSKAFSRIYPLYQSLQVERFMTENESEGDAWDDLTPQYSAYKEKHYGKYPGGGRKLLIATSTLAGAVIGPGAPFEGVDKHRAIFSPFSMRITVEESGNNAAGKPFNYPKYVAERRPFMEFSEESFDQMRDALKKYLIGK